MNTAKAGKSKYAVDYNHPVDKQEENWQADYNYNSEKSTAKKDNVRGKSRGSANGKAPRGRATYSSNKDTKYNTNRGAGDNATKSNRRGNKAVHATANSDTQHTISHKVNKAKSNKYLAECVQSVNSSAETSSNRAKAKSNSARRAKDKTRGEVLDNSTNMDMPPVKRKTTSNKKSKQYNHYS